MKVCYYGVAAVLQLLCVMHVAAHQTGVNIVKIGSKSRHLNGPPEWVQTKLVELGVVFKVGVTVTTQSAPGKFETAIADADGCTFSFSNVEPINMFSPEYFDVSQDGTYVTEKATGKMIDFLRWE
jgi:hypothetical protein